MMREMSSCGLAELRPYGILAGVLLSFISTARAGMLVVDEYGLKQVAERGEAVYVAKIVTPPKKGELELEITAVHQTGSKRARAAGFRLRTKIYTGVVWDDPRKSPIETRLAGSEPASSYAKGDLVIVVPHDGSEAQIDLLAPSEANLRKLSILFDAATREAHLRTADATILERDLSDRDLAELAYEALSGSCDVTSRRPRSTRPHLFSISSTRATKTSSGRSRSFITRSRTSRARRRRSTSRDRTSPRSRRSSQSICAIAPLMRARTSASSTSRRR
jgi:hypothetical protein